MKFTIPGEPVAQGRPRFSNRGGFTKVYDPPKSKVYKKFVSEVAKKNIVVPFEKQIKVKIDVYRFIPKNFSKKKTLLAINKELRPDTKPDIDNYAKGILDGCNGIVWKDDNLIVSLTVNKYFSDEPRVEVEVTEL